MSIPNLIPHKTLYISGYIYSYYAFVFIFEFPEHISKHILQFHTSLFDLFLETKLGAPKISKISDCVVFPLMIFDFATPKVRLLFCVGSAFAPYL